MTKYRIRKRRCVTQMIEVEALTDEIAEFKVKEGEGITIGFPRTESQIEIISARSIPDSKEIEFEKDLK